jgi:site-specific DNA recombinase
MRAATYTRFSTDRQSEGDAGSIAQQITICRELAARHGFELVAGYRDEAISGAALGNRPGLRDAIAAAEAGEFDVLIVADLSRLSRSQADLPRIIERLAFRGVRVLGVQDGFDSSREDADLSAGLHGIMGQAFRKMIASRTRSALKMRAERGSHAGGKPFGYRCIENAKGKALAIDETQAVIVREIFERYSTGTSTRSMAADFNARGISAPGAAWNRESRRKDGRWLASALYAIVQNEIYRGEVIWNRSRWTKDPDSGVRRRDERPRSEWIVRQDESLRIVSDALWNAAQARLRSRLESFVGASASVSRRGGQPRYLLSGLLQCEECGSKLIISGGSYTCSSNRNGGTHACSNRLSVSKALTERLFLDRLRGELCSPAAVKHFSTEYTRRCNEQHTSAREQLRKTPAKVTKLDAEIVELEEMIRSGRLSPAIAGAALAKARADRAALSGAKDNADAQAQSKVVRLMPRAAEALSKKLDDLAGSLSDPAIVQRARPLIHAYFGGTVKVRPADSGEHLVAVLELCALPLLKAAGAEINDLQNGSGGRI